MVPTSLEREKVDVILSTVSLTPMVTRREFLAGSFIMPFVIQASIRNAQGGEGASEANSANAALRAELERLRKKHGFPALAAGATMSGSIKALAAVGIRKVGTEESAQVDDRFHIGSCTKAMTATLAGLLVQEGRIQWQSTVASVLPDSEKMHLDCRSITLEMLLTHRAGLPANSSAYGPQSASNTARRLFYLQRVLSTKPPKTPGSAFEYSNAGYIIAGAMLERVAGEPWEDLMRKRLFKPLGMASAGFGPPSSASRADQPWGHVWKSGRFAPAYGDNPPPLGPAGTVHCSLADYLKLADLHASSGTRPPGLLKRATVEFIRTPPAGGNYALGWGVYPRTWAKGDMLTHVGSNTMNYFRATLGPALGFSSAVAINASGPKVEEALEEVTAFLVRRFTS